MTNSFQVCQSFVVMTVLLDCTDRLVVISVVSSVKLGVTEFIVIGLFRLNCRPFC